MEILNELMNNQKELQKSFDLLNRKLDEQTKRPPVVQLDHDAIANQIKIGLPSPEQFDKANQQLKNIVSNIPNKIPLDVSDEILGFTNLKALLIHYVVFFTLALLLGITIIFSKNKEIDVLQKSKIESNEFIGWIQRKQPEIWKKWLDKSTK